MNTMTIQKIADNVQTLLERTDKFVSVLPAAPDETTDFEGYPSASHYYNDSPQNDYATVTQNRRVYEYVVELYIVNKGSNIDKFKSANALIDEIISLFDESIDLSEGLGKSIQPALTPACDIMRPAPGKLERIVTKEGDGLMMTISLYCSADVSFR